MATQIWNSNFENYVQLHKDVICKKTWATRKNCFEDGVLCALLMYTDNILKCDIVMPADKQKKKKSPSKNIYFSKFMPHNSFQ